MINKIVLTRAAGWIGSAVDRMLVRRTGAEVVSRAAETRGDRSSDGPRAFIQTHRVGTFALVDKAHRSGRERVRTGAHRSERLVLATGASA